MGKGKLPVEIRGGENLLKLFEEMPKKLGLKLLRQSMRRSAKVIQAEVLGNAPEGATGELILSIKVRAPKRKKNHYRISIISANGEGESRFYTAYDELGTSRQKPQGFFRRAVDSKANTAISMILEDMKASILENKVA